MEDLEATVGGKTIRSSDIFEGAQEKIHSQGDALFDDPMMSKLRKQMRAEVPLHFGSREPLKNISPQDAYGFTTTFMGFGYAVAKVCKDILGSGAYLQALSSAVIEKIDEAERDLDMLTDYQPENLPNRNPVPHSVVENALRECLVLNVEHFANRFPHLMESEQLMMWVADRVVKKYLMIGYNAGLLENVWEDRKR